MLSTLLLTWAVLAQPIPARVTVYTNVTSSLTRAGLRGAFEDAFPGTQWEVRPAPAAGAQGVDPKAWLLRLEGLEADAPEQPLQLTLKTPEGEGQSTVTLKAPNGGAWLMPLGVCGALACGPCPFCAGPGLGTAYALGTLWLGGLAALPEAILGGLFSGCMTTACAPALFIPPGVLWWPLEASKVLRPVAGYYRTREAVGPALPALVTQAMTSAVPPPEEPGSQPSEPQEPLYQ